MSWSLSPLNLRMRQFIPWTDLTLGHKETQKLFTLTFTPVENFEFLMDLICLCFCRWEEAELQTLHRIRTPKPQSWGGFEFSFFYCRVTSRPIPNLKFQLLLVLSCVPLSTYGGLLIIKRYLFWRAAGCYILCTHDTF